LVFEDPSVVTNTGTLLTRLDSAGNVLWQKIYNNSASSNDQPIGLETDSFGNIYELVQSADGILTTIGLLKYDASGNVKWTNSFVFNSNAQPVGRLLEGDSVQYFVLIDLASPDSVIMEKVDSAGNMIWNLMDTLTPDATAVGIGIENAGNIYVGANTDSAIAVTKYNPSGAVLWKTVTSDSLSVQNANAMFVDTAGNLYLGGMQGNALGYEYVTIKFDPSGNLLWSNGYDGPTTYDDIATLKSIICFLFVGREIRIFYPMPLLKYLT